MPCAHFCFGTFCKHSMSISDIECLGFHNADIFFLIYGLPAGKVEAGSLLRKNHFPLCSFTGSTTESAEEGEAARALGTSICLRCSLHESPGTYTPALPARTCQASALALASAWETLHDFCASADCLVPASSSVSNLEGTF